MICATATVDDIWALLREIENLESRIEDLEARSFPANGESAVFESEITIQERGSTIKAQMRFQ